MHPLGIQYAAIDILFHATVWANNSDTLLPFTYRVLEPFLEGKFATMDWCMQRL